MPAAPPTTIAPADAAAWVALGVSLLGVLPRLVTSLGKTRTDSRRAETIRFEALYDKQDRLIARLESRCDALEERAELSPARKRNLR